MKTYEKPEVEFVSLVSKEEIAADGMGNGILEGITGISSFSIFG